MNQGGNYGGGPDDYQRMSRSSPNYYQKCFLNVQQEKDKQHREIVKFMQRLAYVLNVPPIILHSACTYNDDPLLTHLQIYESMFPDPLASVERSFERTVIGDNMLLSDNER